MLSGTRFTRSLKRVVSLICLLLTFFILILEIHAAENTAATEVRQFVQQWMERTQKIIRQTYRNQGTAEVYRLMEQDTILLDSQYFFHLLGKHPIVDFEIKEAAKSIHEAHTFKMIGMQNRSFDGYRAVEKDSRFYEIMRANFVNLAEKLSDRGRWFQMNQPGGQTAVHFMRRYFVPLNGIDQYNHLKNKITGHFKNITNLIYDEDNAEKNIAALNFNLAQVESLIVEMQGLEAKEKVIEQQSMVDLSSYLYHYYCEDFQKIARLLKQDFRRLRGDGLWQFEVYEIPCSVTVDICPQCRGLRWSDQKWIFRLVRFHGDGKNSGWKIWSIDVGDIKEN